MELTQYENALNETYNQIVKEQRSPVAIRIMQMGQTAGKQKFDEREKSCKADLVRSKK